MKDRLDLPDPFEAAVWVDPVIDATGKDAFGPYPEAYWLPHVGPSAFLVARRLLADPGTWDKATLARAVGIGHRSTLEKALARLEGYRLATDSGGVLHVRRYWPRLPPNLLVKLPAALQEGEGEMAA